jgi:hypothetical protein
MRPPGTLLLIGGTGGRRSGIGLTLASTMTAAFQRWSRAWPRGGADPSQPHRRWVRRHPLSASLLGDQLDAAAANSAPRSRSARVVGPADAAALALHLMSNNAPTGATDDIDGGQQLLSNRGEPDDHRNPAGDGTDRPSRPCPPTRSASPSQPRRFVAVARLDAVERYAVGRVRRRAHCHGAVLVQLSPRSASPAPPSTNGRAPSSAA